MKWEGPRVLLPTSTGDHFLLKEESGVGNPFSFFSGLPLLELGVRGWVEAHKSHLLYFSWRLPASCSTAVSVISNLDSSLSRLLFLSRHLSLSRRQHRCFLELKVRESANPVSDISHVSDSSLGTRIFKKLLDAFLIISWVFSAKQRQPLNLFLFLTCVVEMRLSSCC